MDRISSGHLHEDFVFIPTDSVSLEGNLVKPADAQGIVLFAHGSGSSRHSPRNRYVASVLQQKGLATLLLDLLTAQEEELDRWTRQLRFDIDLLASRLVSTTDWLLQNPLTGSLSIGYFGASTGSAAALSAAALRPDAVKAVVSRGGRPDLASSALAKVQAPVLLIVGGDDFPIISINQEAEAHLPPGTDKQLEIIPGATHLFEEPGALERVAELAGQWFIRYLVRAS